MTKGIRRFYWVALVLWLGCGSEGSQDSASDHASASTREAVPHAAESVESDNAASLAATPSAASASKAATGTAATSGSASGPTPMTAAAASTTPAGAAASSGGSAPGAADGAAEEAAVPAMAGAASSAGSSASTGAPSGDAASDQDRVPASVLTAGAWDDNRNYERFDKYRKELAEQQLPGMMPSTDDEHAAAHKAFAQPLGPQDKLDVALVIDTTGSMGDEIRYLQSEFLALSTAIEDRYPDAQQRWSLVVYRDEGDEYVTRSFDFSDDVMAFRDKLAMQSAGGGGDFPESPDAALEAMAQLDWRSDDKVARLAFWVADAPHHDEKAKAMLSAIHAARDIGVHLYPVASSGIDELTEVTMRSSAQLTGGRYLFLTDDSGIGGAHKEPSIPCYFVTKLNKAILRMVDIEMTGVYAEPSPDDIIRTGGDPQDGSCELSSGEVVEAF